MSANIVHFDDNTTWAVQIGTQAFPSIFSFKDCHFENLAGGTQHYISGGTATSINMVGGHMGDDIASGTGDFMIQTSGATFTAFGTTVNAQRTTTTILQANTPVRVWAQFVDQTQNTIPTLITGTSNSITDFSINGINAGGGRAQIFGEASLAPKVQGGGSLGTSTSGQWSNYFGYQFDILEAGAPSAGGAFHDNCYGDSTAHMLKCSYNNGAFGNLPLTTNTSTTATQVVHATATAGLYTTSAIATGDLPTAIPIGNVGSAGLSGTAPVAISAAGAISCTTCTNNNSAIVNFNRAAQSQVVVSATEYYITRSDLDMPAAYTTAIGAGTTMRWRISLTKTAAGTGTFQVLLKKGTNGSTADTSIVTQTIGTQTAAADNMEMDVQLTWTSATAAYWTIIPRQSAATATGFGLVYPAAAAQFSGTIAGQTTTTASDKYGLSLIFTTGTPTFVVNEVQAQAFGVN